MTTTRDDHLLNENELGTDHVQISVDIDEGELANGGYVTLEIISGESRTVELYLANAGDDVLTSRTPGDTHVYAYDAATGIITFTELTPAEGGTVQVEATQTDLAGNESLPGSDYAVLDTLEPPRPVVTIVDDNNPDDHLLNENELGTDHVQISVDINEGELANGGYVTLEIISGESRTVELYLANAGDDVLTSRTPGDTHVYAYDAATGIITFTELTPAEGGTVQVEATQTDLAGNESLPGSDYAVLDTLEPPRPVVTIVDDNNPDDHLLNENELGTDHVQISVDIDEGELANGGYVTLEITSGESRTVELYLANAGDDVLTSRTPGDTHVYAYDAATGIITFTELTPAEGGTVQVEATQTDLAGNESLPGSDYAVLDTLEPPRPVVTIVDDNNPDDHLLNENELGTDHVQISVDIDEGELANGGYVTLEIISGESRTVELYLANAGDDVLTSRTPGDTHVYAYDAATGIITFTELTPAEGGTVQVEATQTDLAGNESLPGSDYAVLDTLEPPRPVVTIVDDNNPDDHLLNENELGTDHVQISVDIDEGELANGGYVTLEIISGESRTVELYLANAGDDVLTSRTPGDTHVYAYDAATGIITFTELTPAEGGTVQVEATQTDLAGNESLPGSDYAVLDTLEPPRPLVTIVDDNNPDDHLLNENELGTDHVQISVDIDEGELANGGYVTLEIISGESRTVELYLANAGDDVLTSRTPGDTHVYAYDAATGIITFTELTPAEGGTVQVEATQTDLAGNESLPGSDYAVLDTLEPPRPVVTIVDDNNPDDHLLNENELGTDHVQISVDIDEGELANGGYVTLEIISGESRTVELYLANAGDDVLTSRTPGDTHVYAYDAATGIITFTELTPAEGGTVQVEATQTDLAGNESLPGSDYAVLDTLEPPRPVVTIVDDSNNDTLLSSTELGDDHVQISVDVDEDELANGGFVTLEITSGESRTVELYLANAGDDVLTSRTPGDTHVYAYDAVTGLITFTELEPTDGNTVRVDATQTDLAGNESLPASDYAVLPPITYASGTGWQMNYNKTDNSFDMRVKSPGTATATLYAGATIHWDIIVQDSDHNAAISVLADAEMPASASFHVDELYAADGQTIFRVYMTTSETIQLSEPQGFGIDIQVVDSDGSAYLINSNEYIAPHDNYKEDYSETFNLTDVLTGHDQEWLSPDTDGGEFTSLTPTPGSGVTDLHYGGGNDAVYGTVYNDGIFGDAGNDFIDGRAGDDTLHGGSGEDVLLGGYGTDTLIGDLGNDILTGGDGADIFTWTSADIGSSDTITDFSIAQHDMLDLTDVLTNEPANDLTNYLSFGTNTDGDVLVNVHASGDVNITDMTIVIQNPTDTLTELQTYLQNGTGVIHN
ncbi:Hemolysin-type calcium-binding region [Tolumonas auensis DSM 9187]|uniref:Hemolysin-type calcium-binding region n=1 Tax=Tolumonas auensis (strain DSM 9187 / NBRC 110442 / TA 4) TaxID=595494 RepID=C4LE63_TOLAT|nr:type I secretion C-terminal target domain-containing protein [Tolumonas auensis]ACQ92884.1 Hemolysin-type calcium-binding region [Tolumonas auensis DSM 9187]